MVKPWKVIPPLPPPIRMAMLAIKTVGAIAIGQRKTFAVMKMQMMAARAILHVAVRFRRMAVKTLKTANEC